MSQIPAQIAFSDTHGYMYLKEINCFVVMQSLRRNKLSEVPKVLKNLVGTVYELVYLVVPGHKKLSEEVSLL